ncbi:MAG: hypothetical protein ACK5NG_05140 [Chthoniobacterales bacterium]
MKLSLLAPALSILFFSQALLSAATPDQIRKQLEELLANRSRQKEQAQLLAIKEISQAAENSGMALNMYEDSIKLTQFEGKSGQLQDMVDWKKKNVDWLKSRAFSDALKLHLRYLALTLQRTGSDKPENFIKPSQAYLMSLQEAKDGNLSKKKKPPTQATKLLAGSIVNSPFVRLKRLEPFLVNLPKDWALNPGDAEGILEKNIRPFMRNKKDSALIKTWDWQINYEANEAEGSELDITVKEFNTTRKPELEAARAKDIQLLGNNDAALQELMRLLKNYPAHPNFEAWIQQALSCLPPDSAAPTGQEQENTEQSNNPNQAD